MTAKMLLIQLSLDDYDRMNEKALLPMATATFEQDPRRGPVTLSFESAAYFNEAVEALDDQGIRHQAIEQTDS